MSHLGGRNTWVLSISGCPLRRAADSSDAAELIGHAGGEWPISLHVYAWQPYRRCKGRRPGRAGSGAVPCLSAGGRCTVMTTVGMRGEQDARRCCPVLLL